MRTSHRLAFGLLLAATTLSAGDFGAQLGVQQATGSFKSATDSKVGYTFGLHYDRDLAAAHTLRARLDYGAFPTAVRRDSAIDGSTGNPMQAETRLDFSALSLGADYIYRPSGRADGFYLLAGLAGTQWRQETKVKATEAGFPDVNLGQTTTASKVTWSAGAGWQFDRRWGAELRYSSSPNSGSAGDLNVLTLGATVRF